MIYIVSELYYPEETSTGYIITKIAEGLAETLPVQVVTGPPDYSGLKAAPNSEIRNGVRIERIRAFNLNKNKISSRVLRSVTLSVGLAVKTLKMLKAGDTVFVVTNPAPLLVLLSLVCRYTNSSLIILVHDVFPENLHAAKLLQKSSLLFRVLARLFNSVYKSANHIIVIGRDMKDVMTCKINSSYPEISVITNWSDTEEVYPEKRNINKIVNNLKLERTFIVQFAGNLGRVQGIEQIVAAAEILKNEKMHFVIIGNGAKRGWLVAQVANRKLTNITILDTMPRSEQQLFLNACDVGLVCLATGMTGLGVPSKTYNILAAGKPLIAVVDQASEVGLLVQEENIGWVVTPEDPESLASAIREASKYQGLYEMGKKSREIAETKYSLQRIISKYRDVLGLYERN